MLKTKTRKITHHAIGKGTLLLFLFMFTLGLTVSASAAGPFPELKVFRGPSVPTIDRVARGFLADEVIVKLKHGSQPFYRIKVANSSVLQAIASLRQRSDVLFAEPNYLAYAFAVPNDPYYSFQWHLDNPAYGGVNAQTAWDVSQGSGVVVAVIDTGIAYENYNQSVRNRYYQAPDLAGACFVAGYDFVNNDTHPNDDNSHGTHVAGTIAQRTNNSTGVAGLAYQSCLMPLKVLNSSGSGTYADIAEAIRWAADHGAKVINMSLGGPSGTSYLEDALKYAYDKGVTIVAAAGNDNSGTISYPAAYNAYVIAVGATRYDETRAPYSNYGAGLDIVAPGGDTSVDQNADGYPDGVLQNTFNPNTKKTNDFNYWFFQGTSMATPHVAAAAALVIAHGNATSPDEVRAALQTTAKDLGAPDWDSTFGWGRVNAAAALGWTSGPVDNPPSVLLTNPANDAIVTSTITISATASDDNGVSQVDFYVDANLIASDSDVPYETSWDSTQVADGSHTVKAVSVDSAGQTATDQASITVDNVNDPPVANAGPDQSATLGNGLNFNGSGSSDPDGSIVSYGWDFGDGQSATGTTTSHTYNATSSYTVTLTVIDNGGATDTDTATVVITEVPAQPTMHISDISFSPTVRKYGSQKRCRVTATATVANATGGGVASATLSGNFSGAYSRSVSGSTSSTGKVSFTTGWVLGCGTFTFSVNNVVKSNWVYQPSDNVETSDSIILP